MDPKELSRFFRGKMLKDPRKMLKDPLYKSSFFIVLTSISSAAIGFFFWIFAARLYSSEELGISVALISLMTFPISVSRFGMDQSLIRFLPKGDKNRIISTSLIVPTAIAMLFGFVILIGIDFFAPSVHIVSEYALEYLMFLAAISLLGTAGQAFIAMRKSEYYFLQSLMVNSRILLIFPLVFLGSVGVFSAVGISSILGFLISMIILWKLGIKLTRPDRGYLRSSIKYSLGNFVSTLFMTTPSSIIPLLILGMLGAGQTAYYFIAYNFAVMIMIVPGAFSTSILVEGSHGESLRLSTIKSLRTTYMFLIPMAAIILIFGEYILGIIGKDYIAGFGVLSLMVLSTFFSTIYGFYFSIKQIQKKIRTMIALSALYFALLIGFSYSLIGLGLVGVGYAYLLGCAILAIIIGILAKHEKLW
jgi:O-antigen/teichoic acid export membrane protein